MHWKSLVSPDQLAEIRESSFLRPSVIFKHSTRCNISAVAKHRLEQNWDFSDVDVYHVDVLNDRPVSDEIASRYAVRHESPQLLLIRNGECVYDASHLAIRTGHLKEALK